MKNLFILIFLATSLSAWSQVSVKTDVSGPGPGIMPDAQSTHRGMLLPGMTLALRAANACLLRPAGV